MNFFSKQNLLYRIIPQDTSIVVLKTLLKIFIGSPNCLNSEKGETCIFLVENFVFPRNVPLDTKDAVLADIVQKFRQNSETFHVKLRKPKLKA